ncbi:hypothetical protein GC096_29700 [Paenibacillus sp. LMG 31461]|uniref:Holin n=1 Tax=Paenibacillus plantarum TaxID=2654975 RepID=A0ABX1XID0_9BACL|nr:hypothetical protein [Paenibacillus plantarum]NOU68207.1 hypothetical protein [Paenibacillus plantarum]
MVIDKVKVLRYLSLVLAICGIGNMIAGHYGHGISDTEIDFYANVISYAASIVLGVTVESKMISGCLKERVEFDAKSRPNIGQE